MDTQWQTETDQALNALRAQLARLRTLAGGLAVVVVALAAWIVFTIVHQPKSIVLTGPDGSLKLEPGQITMKVGTSTIDVEIDGIWLRDEAANIKRVTHLAGGSLDLAGYPKSSTVSKSMVHLDALGKYAGLTMLAAPDSATLKVGGTGSELSISALDKSLSLEATPTRAKLTGIGTTFFGLGDTALGSAAPPPAAPPK